ncbi:MAG: hypothetical protein NTW79_00305 [Candidatus Berkelbacteria bacterium]|nr:hypothetical protein [Candidatus Berkelbacteria bacterium]
MVDCPEKVVGDFTRVIDPPYAKGLVDLAEICHAVRRSSLLDRITGRKPNRVLIHDLNPPLFWDLSEAWACIQDCSEVIGQENVVFYITTECDSSHPFIKMERSGLIRVRQPIVSLTYGFRIAEKGLNSIVSIMKPNPSNPQFPLIMRLNDLMDVGAARSQIENDLAHGYYASTF